MGLMRWLFGRGARELSGAVRDVSEVFVENKTRKSAQNHAQFLGAQKQYEAEFQNAPQAMFDIFINGLNRLPRPVMALGTVGLFTFAMIDPVAFSYRMQGLATIPEALWWLLGAVVSFYFGARELHHFRQPRQTGPRLSNTTAQGFAANLPTKPFQDRPSQNGYNAALEEWRAQRK